MFKFGDEECFDGEFPPPISISYTSYRLIALNERAENVEYFSQSSDGIGILII